jgi:putative serine protease PepD
VTLPAGRLRVVVDWLIDALAVVEDVLPSVVEITHEGAVGSGVVFDNQGNIVTIAHVVGTATGFEVRLAHSSTVRQATLVYSYPTEDLAVIRLMDTGGLVPARFGDAGKLQVGDIVMAMGSPLGLESSVTQGIVSALGRPVSEPPEPQIGLPGTVLRQTIQTSAPINRGLSGSPWPPSRTSARSRSAPEWRRWTRGGGPPRPACRWAT